MGSDRIIYSPGVTVFKSDDEYPENLDNYQYFEKIVFAIKPTGEYCPNLAAFESCFVAKE